MTFDARTPATSRLRVYGLHPALANMLSASTSLRATRNAVRGQADGLASLGVGASRSGRFLFVPQNGGWGVPPSPTVVTMLLMVKLLARVPEV